VADGAPPQTSRRLAGALRELNEVERPAIVAGRGAFAALAEGAYCPRIVRRGRLRSEAGAREAGLRAKTQ